MINNSFTNWCISNQDKYKEFNITLFIRNSYLLQSIVSSSVRGQETVEYLKFDFIKNIKALKLSSNNSFINHLPEFIRLLTFGNVVESPAIYLQRLIEYRQDIKQKYKGCKIIPYSKLFMKKDILSSAEQFILNKKNNEEYLPFNSTFFGLTYTSQYIFCESIVLPVLIMKDEKVIETTELNLNKLFSATSFLSEFLNKNKFLKIES